jgi:hypothetical protein
VHIHEYEMCSVYSSNNTMNMNVNVATLKTKH